MPARSKGKEQAEGVTQTRESRPISLEERPGLDLSFSPLSGRRPPSTGRHPVENFSGAVTGTQPILSTRIQLAVTTCPGDRR